MKSQHLFCDRLKQIFSSDINTPLIQITSDALKIEPTTLVKH